MDLRCQYCGERIVARGFGKCPGCYRDLPEELQLSTQEKEMEELDRKARHNPADHLPDACFNTNYDSSLL